jgi:glyoxylase-like metal-dependent hydrolase (beta-lactamase superfamily II)
MEAAVTHQITPIRLPLPFKLSHVYSHLVKTDRGFFLIDTGMTNARHQLEGALEHLCCQPGDLKLILLTHGDFDHTGNAAYLRRKFDTRIAMHEGDVGMLENGDMFWNRKIKNSLLKIVLPLFIHFGKKEQCTPDLLLPDGTSLAEYGLDAQALNTPGHSTGSICILTNSGDLFCGDLLTNSTGKPMLNPMMYDTAAGYASYDRLKTFSIKMVYPGHGRPFPWEALKS